MHAVTSKQRHLNKALNADTHYSPGLITGETEDGYTPHHGHHTASPPNTPQSFAPNRACHTNLGQPSSETQSTSTSPSIHTSWLAGMSRGIGVSVLNGLSPSYPQSLSTALSTAVSTRGEASASLSTDAPHEWRPSNLSPANDIHRRRLSCDER